MRAESPGRQEVEGQITFDDLETEKEEKDPRTLAVEKIGSAVEIDDLKSMGSDLEKDFGGDEELEAVFKKRSETIDLRDRHIRNIRDYKTLENLKWLFEYTKGNQDFTRADKVMIYEAIKQKLGAEGWTEKSKNADTSPQADAQGDLAQTTSEDTAVVADGENDKDVVADGTVDDEIVVDGEPEDDGVTTMGEDSGDDKGEVPGFNEFLDNFEEYVSTGYISVDEKTTFDDVKKKVEKIYGFGSIAWNKESWERFIDRVERKFNETKNKKEREEFTPRREAIIGALEDFLNENESSTNDKKTDIEPVNKKDEGFELDVDGKTFVVDKAPKSEMPLDEALENCPDSTTFARLVRLDEENLNLYLGKLKERFPDSETMRGAEKTLRDRFIIKYGEDFDDYNERMLKVDEDDQHGVKFETIEEYEARRERVAAAKKAKRKTLGGFIKKFEDEAAEMGSVIKVIDQLSAEDLKDVSMDTIRNSLEYYYYMSKGGKIKVYRGEEARDKSSLVGFSDEMRGRIQSYATEKYKQLGLDYMGRKDENAPKKRKLRDRVSHWIIGQELRRLGA